MSSVFLPKSSFSRIAFASLRRRRGHGFGFAASCTCGRLCLRTVTHRQGQTHWLGPSERNFGSIQKYPRKAATVGETVHILNRVLTDVYSSLMGWGT